MKNQAKMSKQSECFIEKACELGCDEDEAAFEERLRRVAKAKRVEISAKSPISDKRDKQ